MHFDVDAIIDKMDLKEKGQFDGELSESSQNIMDEEKKDGEQPPAAVLGEEEEASSDEQPIELPKPHEPQKTNSLTNDIFYNDFLTKHEIQNLTSEEDK